MSHVFIEQNLNVLKLLLYFFRLECILKGGQEKRTSSLLEIFFLKPVMQKSEFVLCLEEVF